MDIFLREQPTAITEYNEPLVRRLIEKVTVHMDKFTVEFKSGVTVDVIKEGNRRVRYSANLNVGCFALLQITKFSSQFINILESQRFVRI